ncbi:hypothetical protein [Mesorhizobium opportunistum]|uniref:Uncharacterized protein n=1 Tax=Mesorhizobium opportunistum (strain LMG 24607 / HAMBI 3007 / WSM2075) TaxID=536019 RepID=F7Y0Y9_MESOW|nr:hypothetical protein [Mesorhizobium opportunistum]AEH88202.1 hypothetical protein Mesop_3761 [Mesorhizobium opportunistum WSM2075]
MTDLTLLRLDPIGVPPYSARGITQSLDPIDGAAQLARTVNGVLIDLSDPAFRKYKSTIACTDQDQPALDGVWPGDVLTVDCVQELSYRTMGGSPARTVASTTDDPATRTEGDFTFYRPRLTMMVVGYSKTFDEWGAESGWSMDLEEVG